jgi:hypothetical protein
VNKTLGDIQDSREELIRSISREAGKKLRMLLEEKHIYQNVVIDAKSLIGAWAAKVRTMSSGILIDDAEFDNAHLVMSTTMMSFAEKGAPKAEAVLTLLVENPKL